MAVLMRSSIHNRNRNLALTMPVIVHEQGAVYESDRRGLVDYDYDYD
jgi:hypothetical protein